ncbi:MAG TPA: energy transducer TonB [Candidatus Xenobia bacterium]|nr:energy transducer TonB [Candidatus Xenobia bacterium]
MRTNSGYGLFPGWPGRAAGVDASSLLAPPRGVNVEPRLLVDLSDPFANIPVVTSGIVLPSSGQEDEPQLLLDWSDPLLRIPVRRAALVLPGKEGEPETELATDWTDEVATLRWRTLALTALVLHVVAILLLAIWPRLFPERELTAEERKQRAKDSLAILYIPPDVLELPPMPKQELTPEERKRATVHSPIHVDPKELERIIPPTPPPAGGALPGAPSLPVPLAPERSERTERPERSREIVRLEDLPQRPGGPGAGVPLPKPTTPGRAIEESLRRAQSGGGQGGPGGVPGPGLGTGPINPRLNTPYPIILSDTKGVDFGPYLVRLLNGVRRNWYAVMPESAYLGDQGKVVIIFTINKDGSVPPDQPDVVSSSGKIHLDRPALAAIRSAQPFPPLPSEFTGDNIVIQFTFLYNLPAEYPNQ